MSFRNSPEEPLHSVRRKTFLGLPAYEKLRSDDRLQRLFAGGILSEEVRFNSSGECGREMRLLDHVLWQRTIQNDELIVRFGRGWLVSRTSIRVVLDDELERLFADTPVAADPKGFKHVVVFWANSGEIAMLLNGFMPRLLGRMGLSGKGDVVFLCTKPYHADMARLFFPTIPAVVAKPVILRHVTGDLRTSHWDVKVCFTGRYFYEFERQAHKADSKALDALDWMGAEFDLPVIPLRISAEVSERLDALESVADAKAEEPHLDWKKTILVCPGSSSCGMLPADTLALIHRMAEERGFSVVFNRDTGRHRLTMPELLSKARHAAGIIGIRSGLMDLLVSAQVPMLVFYRAFPDRGFNTRACTAETVLRMFSLKRPENSSFVTESLVEPVDSVIGCWIDSLRKLRKY